MTAPKLLTTAALLEAQDTFGSLHELLRARERHEAASRLDARRDAALEDLASAMARHYTECTCGCPRVWLPKLMFAGDLDAEFDEQIVLAETSEGEAARLIRLLSGWIEWVRAGWVRLHPGRPKPEAA